MRRSIALILAAAVLMAVLATPAVAGTDPLQLLQQLIDEGKKETDGLGGQADSTFLSVLVPDAEEVALDVDLEEGLSHQERLTAYIARLEGALRANPTDFESIVKKGFAHQMLERHDMARDAFERAIQLQPSALPVYGALAQSVSMMDPGIKVYANGRLVEFDVQPAVVNGRTLVPFRAVAETLGGKVEFDAATYTAIVTLGGNRVEVTRDSSIARVNGMEHALAVPATIINGRFLLPLRFVGESVGEQVEYHPGLGAGNAVISIFDK